ncbi:ATP-dependent helicase [Gimesia sp.]|uniref:ATP-dependent helicase n=1 Tax=Gimesia sp. TaxID=2024833 RepID=UPI0032EF02F1
MIQRDVWMPSGGIKLEPNAFTAATSFKGSVALMAGPGAGKTEMLAQRADFLLRTGKCRFPKRILAISFKRDASSNLKERVQNRCGRELSSRLDSHTFHAFAKRIIDIFRPFLKGDDQLDENYIIAKHRAPKTQITFNDMVPLANQILRSCPEARNSVLQTYSDVFLDEFQDCTKDQYSLIKLAFLESDTRLVAVGDTKQKIMGWAGALDGIFLDFRNDFDAQSLNLYQNFRSLPRIRRVQNDMVKDIDPDAAVKDDELLGDNGIVTIESFANEKVEANWIADSIESWINAGIPPSEIAILCNTQPHLYAKSLMDELEDRNIPFRNEQEVQDLFCEPIYKLIVDFLVVLRGSNEPDSWERFFSVVAPDHFDDTNDIRSRTWSDFIEEKQSELNGSIDFTSIWECVEELIQNLGDSGVNELSRDYENKKWFSELLDSSEKQVQNCFNGNADFVESLKGLSNFHAVRILTIHKCKGLEFNTVIVQGVEKETFFGKLKDSQCAFFVAISRAKQSLIITKSEFRTKLPGANDYWKQNRTSYDKFISYVEPHVGGEA